jgi:beta-lactamase class A
MTQLRDRIAHAAAAARATAAAMALYDYEKAQPFSHEGARWFHAASTIKAPLLLAVYRMAEHVRNRFHSQAGGLFRVAASRDGDSEVHRRRGRSMRVRDLARAMIVRSSNLATNVLLDFIGIDHARRALAQARMDGIRLRRGVEDTAAFQQGINNQVTAEGLVRCFRLLCQDHFFRADTRAQMIEVFSAQEFNAMLPAPLPREARIAHKTGEISTICHDAGIWMQGQRYGCRAKWRLVKGILGHLQGFSAVFWRFTWIWLRIAAANLL